MLHAIPFRGSSGQGDISPEFSFKARSYFAPAAIGHSRCQRAHKQGNRFSIESFLVYGEESHPSNIKTGGRRESERGCGNHPCLRLFDQFLKIPNLTPTSPTSF